MPVDHRKLLRISGVHRGRRRRLLQNRPSDCVELVEAIFELSKMRSDIAPCEQRPERLLSVSFHGGRSKTDFKRPCSRPFQPPSRHVYEQPRSSRRLLCRIVLRAVRDLRLSHCAVPLLCRHSTTILTHDRVHRRRFPTNMDIRVEPQASNITARAATFARVLVRLWHSGFS